MLEGMMHRLTQVLLAGSLTLGGTAANAALEFADWTTVDNNATATGTVAEVTVSLVGSSIFGASLDGTSSIFSTPEFTPALPLSDQIDIAVNTVPRQFTLTFSQAVTNPLLHVWNMASTLTFAGIEPVRVSGNSELTMAGNSAIGANVQQGNGTLQLPGTFSSISFAATFAGTDGFSVQVGFDPAAVAAVPEPQTMVLLLVGLAGLVVAGRRRGLQAPPPAPLRVAPSGLTG